MNAFLPCGFVYEMTARDRHTGMKAWRDSLKNRVPMEGLNAIAQFFKAGTGPANLYMGLWSGAHVPDGTETAATLQSIVTEITGYDGATRKTVTLGSVTDGGLSNADAMARFQFNATLTVNGAFISTTSAKGGSTGILYSIVRFPTARSVDNSIYMDALAAFQLVSM